MTDDSTGAVVDAPPPRDPPQGPPPGGSDAGTSGAANHRRPATAGDGVRFVLRGIGQTLITAGVVVLLFVVYEVYVTNWFAHRAQHKVHTALEQQWANAPLDLPNSGLKPLDGQGIANLYIPRFGTDYAWTVVQGITDADLEKGPGHYPDSQMPGQLGDFAMAGHRVGKGEPFLNLDKLVAGDTVVVETRTTWFVYCVIGAAAVGDVCNANAPGGSLSRTDANGVPGREIVDPSDGQVVLPVPSRPDATAPYSTAYLTMTTCHPKFTATKRMIVHAVLDPQYPKGIAKTQVGGKYSSAVPAVINALYAQIGN
jgi:sortase A